MLHRDDIPLEVIQELESRLPGVKVRCVGDIPEGEMPDEVAEAVRDMETRMALSLALGACIDCGDVIPNYAEALSDDNWKPPAGWKYFRDASQEEGTLLCWQCPECDKLEGSDNRATFI